MLYNIYNYKLESSSVTLAVILLLIVGGHLFERPDEIAIKVDPFINELGRVLVLLVLHVIHLIDGILDHTGEVLVVDSVIK